MDTPDLDKVFPFEYQGGGYFRRKGAPRGVAAEMLHGWKAIEWLYRELAQVRSATPTGESQHTKDPGREGSETATDSPIPLDIDNPKCPRAVIHSMVADTIRAQYSEVGLAPDPLLAAFLESQPEGRGYDWQSRVRAGLCDQPIELIQRWVDKGLPRGFFRAEIRAYLKQRIAERDAQLDTDPSGT